MGSDDRVVAHHRQGLHRLDRAARVPRMDTVEEPFELMQAIDRSCHAKTLIVVDCLTLWLTGQLMPPASISIMISVRLFTLFIAPAKV